MFIRMADAIEKPLWEGSLEPSSEESMERLSAEWIDPRHKPDLQNIICNLPAVSIGQPEIWTLPQPDESQRMPDIVRAELGEADFYLARFSCSFQPRREDVQVQWAHFSVRLVGAQDGLQLTVFDLHPIQVTHDMKRDVKVELGPCLKFQEVEETSEDPGVVFEYPDLKPLVVATGVGESTASWNYAQVRGLGVQGRKWMHLLVRSPRGLSRGECVLDLAADLRIFDLRLPVLPLRNKNEAAARLKVRLWG